MRVLVFLVVLGVVSLPVVADGAETHSGVQRQLDVSVPRLDEEIDVDDVLNEAVWERRPSGGLFAVFAS